MIQAYVNGVQTEINGFGYVRAVDGGFYLEARDDVFITRQEVTMGTADNTGAALAKAEYRAIMDGRREELRLQWHSHVWGSTYHSATDMATIERLGRAGAEWFVSVVVNKRGQVTARMDQFRPFRIGAPMQVEIIDFTDKAMRDRAAAEIAELVTIKPQPKKKTIIQKITGDAAQA